MSLDIWVTHDVDLGGPNGPETLTLFETNITHNLSKMWKQAGVYDALYESEGQLAGLHADTLIKGVDYMATHEAECRQHDAPNGWGTYKHAVAWLREVAAAFRRYPKGVIHISR